MGCLWYSRQLIVNYGTVLGGFLLSSVMRKKKDCLQRTLCSDKNYWFFLFASESAVLTSVQLSFFRTKFNFKKRVPVATPVYYRKN
jgi:hypothetical protein